MFNNIYYLNLAKRKDRRIICEEYFKELGWEVERIEAYEGNFNKSHIEAIGKIKGNGLILEDDIKFKNLDTLEQAIKELPEDWDLFYLGANIRAERLKRYSTNLFHLENAWTTHAIAYSEKGAKWILENFHEDDVIYDEFLRINQEKLKCFIISPLIAFQRAGYSDIEKRYVNYETAFNSSNNILCQ